MKKLISIGLCALGILSCQSDVKSETSKSNDGWIYNGSPCNGVKVYYKSMDDARVYVVVSNIESVSVSIAK